LEKKNCKYSKIIPKLFQNGEKNGEKLKKMEKNGEKNGEKMEKN
jgi:hypothetical protein